MLDIAMPQRIIFSDIDGTLAHELHDGCQIRLDRIDDGTFSCLSHGADGVRAFAGKVKGQGHNH
jgi:hypothetical protein